MSGFAIGVDLGDLLASEAHAGAAREAGATHVRVRLGLGGRAEPDDALLGAAGTALRSLRSHSLDVTLAVGPDITVAPGGLGAFQDPPAGALAEAWEQEWCRNLTRLADALAAHVAAWELLPHPTTGPAPIDPRRWLALIAAGADAIRATDGFATVLPGAVIADGGDEPAGTLGRALDREGAELWHEAGLGGLVLELAVAADPGASEAEVIASVRRAVENASTMAAERLLEPVDARLVLVSWSADGAGDDIQARNLWAAFNTLSAMPRVRGAIWRSLLDAPPAASGLYRGGTAANGDRRPAWAAFNDFAVYAAQIAPAPVFDLEATAAPVGELVHFRVPAVAELLRAQGLHGRRLEAAAAAAARTYGDALPPGDYEVHLPPGLDAGPEYTNQDVISAFYRAGGGTWDLLEKSGLALRDLATDRNAPYTGAPVEMLTNLDDSERAAILAHLT